MDIKDAVDQEAEYAKLFVLVALISAAMILFTIKVIADRRAADSLTKIANVMRNIEIIDNLPQHRLEAYRRSAQ